MAEKNGSSFPKYKMIVGDREQWVTLHEAGILFDSGYVAVSIGGEVYDDYGAMRQITDEEKQKIADIADEWSENK